MEPEEPILPVQSLIGRVAAGENLSQTEMTTAIEAIIEGRCTDGEIGVFLTSLSAKGETDAEVAGAAWALRHGMTPIRSRREGLLDTCGTGGDGSHTFNISTAAAIVVSSAGVPIAKHGNRGITSASGSADVLAELGVNIDASVEQVQTCIDEIGIGFCFAPLLHPGMKRVAAVRKQLGAPTIFNILGPLCNPASAPYQLLGVARPELRPLMARALTRLGVRRAVVVWGEDGLDEVSLQATTQVTLVRDQQLEETTWTPEQFGAARSSLEGLRVDGPSESAATIRSVLSGQTGPARDIVALNAAAGLYTVGRSADLRQCFQLAQHAIDTGAASGQLEKLAARSRQ